MIGVEVILPSGEEKSALCKVLRRSVDEEGTPMGIYNSDPSLNTKIHDVEFPDGLVRKYGVNLLFRMC
eukprot:scaffold4761_cov105-Skeletonema_dohrnii-CCMP3373.AAC.3